MKTLLIVIQIIVSIGLITVILFQQKSGGGSAIFGGGGGGGSYYTKRGFEKILYISTIILAALFIIISFVNLLI